LQWRARVPSSCTGRRLPIAFGYEGIGRAEGEIIMKTTTVLAALLALAATAATNLAMAQEVTLKAVTAFAEKTQFSKNFERFIDKVNADGKGVVQINYIGGPRAMPPFEVGNAVRTRVPSSCAGRRLPIAFRHGGGVGCADRERSS